MLFLDTLFQPFRHLIKLWRQNTDRCVLVSSQTASHWILWTMLCPYDSLRTSEVI